MLGSGLGGLADELEDGLDIPYCDIPGYPQPSVEGHVGNLRLGFWAGQPVMCLQGRVHLYEGEGTTALKVLVRSLKKLGVELLFLTNACGSLREDVGPGELVAVTDHVNFMGTNPLVGRHEKEYGERFVGLENCWDKDFRVSLLKAAESSGVELHQGVFAGWLGPVFETPAEIRMMRILGCDTVGMSMIPENLVARQCGLKAVGVSVVTNFASGVSPEPIRHDLVLAEAAKAQVRLSSLISQFLRDLPGRTT